MEEEKVISKNMKEFLDSRNFFTDILSPWATRAKDGINWRYSSVSLPRVSLIETI